MGGIGSGRWHRFSGKDTEEDYKSIDVRRWKRAGVLSPPRSFSWHWTVNGDVTGSINVQSETRRVILKYRQRDRGGDWRDEHYPVYLATTPYHLGGERHWFLCPAMGCGRRVAKLYGGAIFACRHCRQLAYQSQRETSSDRAARQADKTRDRLDWPGGILNGSGWGKPKGMHQTTYARLSEKHDAFANKSMAMFMERYGEWGC